jgi:hypothetical protein
VAFSEFAFLVGSVALSWPCKQYNPSRLQKPFLQLVFVGLLSSFCCCCCSCCWNRAKMPVWCSKSFVDSACPFPHFETRAAVVFCRAKCRGWLRKGYCCCSWLLLLLVCGLEKWPADVSSLSMEFHFLLFRSFDPSKCDKTDSTVDPK